MKLFHTPLFLGITESEFETMKELHSMRSSFFFKNGTIFHTGDLIHEIGIIESGSVNIENIDLLGNKSILSNISQGQIFAETYAICHEPMLVDVVAIEDTQVLFADLDILLSNRYASQPYHEPFQRLLADSLQVTVRLAVALGVAALVVIVGVSHVAGAAFATHQGAALATEQLSGQQIAHILFCRPTVSFRVDRYSRMFSTTPGSPIFLLIFSKYSDRFLSRFVSSSFSQYSALTFSFSSCFFTKESIFS